MTANMAQLLLAGRRRNGPAQVPASGGGGGAFATNLPGGAPWTLFRDGTMETTSSGAAPSGGFGYTYDGRVVVDGSMPHGGGAIETFYVNGQLRNGDGGAIIESSGFSAKEIYTCFNIRLSSNYRAHTESEKLWFQAVSTGGTYNLINFKYIGTVSSTTVKLGARRTTGGLFDYYDTYPLTKGSWDDVEIYCKMNTGTSNEDGIFKVWVNGNLLINSTTWQFVSAGAGADAAVFQNFRFDGTGGGGADGNGALTADQTRQVNRMASYYRT